MDEEAGFLSAIHQTPAEETARLAYADWLCERDGSDYAPKAEFVRLELRLAHAPDDDPVHLDGPPRLRQLATTLPSDWLAVLSRPPLEGCRVRLVRPCPGGWELLLPLGSPKLRFCDRCEQTVRFCDSVAEADRFVRCGYTVAVTPAALRHPRDLTGPRPLGAGGTLPPSPVERVVRRREVSDPIPPIRDPVREDDAVKYGAPVPKLPKRRTGGRGRNRSIERQDWEEGE